MLWAVHFTPPFQRDWSLSDSTLAQKLPLILIHFDTLVEPPTSLPLMHAMRLSFSSLVLRTASKSVRLSAIRRTTIWLQLIVPSMCALTILKNRAYRAKWRCDYSYFELWRLSLLEFAPSQDQISAFDISAVTVYAVLEASRVRTLTELLCWTI